MIGDREERIRQRAHEIWEREGRPHGADDRHWHQAAREVDAEDLNASGPSHTPEVAGAKAPAPRKARTQPKAEGSKKVVGSKKSSTAPKRKPKS
ncbi:MAG: DUF2934 domain-containing protein [Mesorhizobium sp.]